MRKLLMTILVAGVLVGAVYGAAATLSVSGVDDLGSATTDVKSPGVSTVTVTDVRYNLLASDASKIASVTVGLTNSGPTETCDVGVTVYSDNDGATPIASASNLNVSVASSTDDTVDIDDTLAESIESVNVTLTCENA